MRILVGMLEWMLVSLLGGTLVFAAGVGLDAPTQPQARDQPAIDCVDFAGRGDPDGAIRISIANRTRAGARFEVWYLGPDSTPLYAERFELGGGATLEVDTAMRNAGHAARVLPSSGLAVSAHLVEDDSAGPPAPIPCAASPSRPTPSGPGGSDEAAPDPRSTADPSGGEEPSKALSIRL